MLFCSEDYRRQIEREREIGHDIVPLTDRLAVEVPQDDVDALLEHLADRNFDADRIAWDLKRQFSDDGFDGWCTLLAGHGRSPNPCVTVRVWGRYDATRSFQLNRDFSDCILLERWQTFERERAPGDSLIVDVLDEHRDAMAEAGWQPSPETVAIYDRLISAAEETRAICNVAERAAEEAAFEKAAASYDEWWLSTPEGQAAKRAEEATKMEAAMGGIVPFPKAPPQPDLIQHSADFVCGFVPPDYLVDGILQRRFCYSLTAQTGVGKTTVAMRLAAHVSAGLPLGNIAVEKGTVLYFAGENPTDIQMRWLGLTHSLGMDPRTADVHFIPGAMPLSQVAERITAEVNRKGLQPALVVVDTAAAYFEGDDENSNAQAAAHAKLLRSLTTLPGGPCVLILCHPTKRAADDDLIPRGGGAFLAEVDGNIALQRRDALLVASAQGKFRGSDAWSLRFELETVRDHPGLKDIRGRQIPTIIAHPVEETAAMLHEVRGEGNENSILRALPGRAESGATPTDVARKLCWFVKGDPNQPAHNKVIRLLQSLRANKLVEQARQNRWRLTAKGEMEANRLEQSAAQRGLPTTPILPP